jgi:hypothetical protein
MSDRPKKRSRVWIWYLVVFVAYPLSPGPVGRIAPKLAAIIYLPLFWVCGLFPPLAGLLFFYWAIWRAIGRSLFG